MIMKTVICSCAILLLAIAGSVDAQPSRKPNVVFILVDDMGYADLSSFGSKDIRTPNIDRLAKELPATRWTGMGHWAGPERTGLAG
jgi:arylsulfatase A-like enzyme